MLRKHTLCGLLAAALIVTSLAACGQSPDEATPTEERTEATTTEAEVTTTTEPEPTETEATETEPPETDATPDGSPELLWTFQYDGEDFAPQALAVHPDGERVTAGAYMATYTHRLYDGELTSVDTEYNHRVGDLSYSPDGRFLATGLGHYGVWVKDLTGELEPLQVHTGFDNFAAFAPDGDVLATGNRSGDVWLWSMPDGEPIAEFSDGERAMLWGLAYHPSGDFIASLQWRDDGVINVWSIEDETLIHSMVPDILVGLSNNVIQYSPDGTLFAAYFRENWEHSLRVFDSESFDLVAEFPLDKAASQIAFSPDSATIAVASIYEPVTLWSIETGSMLHALDQQLEEMVDGTKAIAFTLDGGHLSLLRNYGDMELWRLPDAQPLPEPTIDLYQPIPIPGDVLFDTASSDLKAEADDVLNALAEDIFTTLPAARLTFVGHTDSRGDAAANLQLSVDRAESVKNWFEAWAAASDADAWTFATEGKGETELKTPDVDSDGNFREEAGRVNRRVEIQIEPLD